MFNGILRINKQGLTLPQVNVSITLEQKIYTLEIAVMDQSGISHVIDFAILCSSYICSLTAKFVLFYRLWSSTV